LVLLAESVNSPRSVAIAFGSNAIPEVLIRIPSLYELARARYRAPEAQSIRGFRVVSLVDQIIEGAEAEFAYDFERVPAPDGDKRVSKGSRPQRLFGDSEIFEFE
jgi:hypothetical protein